MQKAIDSYNDFSYWFPKVKNCGMNVPETYFMKLTGCDDLIRAFYMDNPEKDIRMVQEWVDSVLAPELRKEGLLGHIFVKNGRFSNKFDFRQCELYGVSDLARSIVNINYQALCCGAGGCDEIVVRKFVEYDRRNTPCIYGGLPLRNEFRVFYDFDSRSTMFVVNYWDYDYVYPSLYNATDRIVFDHERSRIELCYEEHKEEVNHLVSDAMKSVSGLEGQWSVDVLMDEKGDYWLIDMAVAQRSAYWDRRPQ